MLVSGQFLVQFEIGNVTVGSATPVSGYYVDLATNSTYNDHKKDITTIAGPVTRDGGKVTAWGANLLLSTGTPMFKFFPFVGIGTNKDARAATADLTKSGYNFGLGLGLGLPMKLAVDVRGEMQMIVNGDVSRKFANVTAGVSYRFFSLPGVKP